ncbi:hypothetical protein [Actinospongicola halichondriae]|uniref:hypothetical protein n=1 Tax=Actinospongicola halichondriae TaxID=3236844 RepID=UPI003D4ADAC7
MAWRRIWFVSTIAVAVVAGCGGGGGGGNPGDAADETSTTEASAAEELPDECPGAVPFDIEIRLDGDGARETMTVVDSIALRRMEGRAWTVYLADFDMPDDTSWSFAVPEVPAGSILVATGLDSFNAPDADALPILETGATGGLFSEVGEGATATFFSITADRAGSTSVSQTGTTELLHLDDDVICLATEITGESGLELVGTYTAAEIVDI